jgi:hypothetical protein
MPKQPKNQPATGAETPQEGANNAPETADEVVGEQETTPETGVVIGDETTEFDEAEWSQIQARMAQGGHDGAEAASENTFIPERVYIKVEFPDIPGREDLIRHLSASGALGDEETPEGETNSLFYWVHLEKGLGTVMQLHLESIGAQPQMITEDRSPSLMEIAGGAAEPLPLDVVLMLAEQTRFFNGEPGKRPHLEKVTNNGDRTIGRLELENPNILVVEYTPRANQADGAQGEVRRLASELRAANAQLKAAEQKRESSQQIILSQVDITKYLSLSEEAQTLFAQATQTNDPAECLVACTELEKIAAAQEDKEQRNYIEPTEQDIQRRAARLSSAIQSVRPTMDELAQDQAVIEEARKRVSVLKGQIKKITPDTKTEPAVYRFDLSEPRNFWID